MGSIISNFLLEYVVFLVKYVVFLIGVVPRGLGYGRPPRGLGPPAPPWATAAAAVGPGAVHRAKGGIDWGGDTPNRHKNSVFH